MEIDASIPLSFRPAQVNPGEALQTAMTVGQLARLRRQDEILEEDRRRAAAVRGATTFLEDGSIDEVGTIRKLTGLVGPDEISKLRHGWQSDRLALRKADADAQSAELKRLDERNKLVGNAVAALGDNPSLEQIDAVFASLEAQGVKGDRSRLPRDQSQVPAFIQEVRNGVMGVEKALANKRAELETQFKIKGPQTQLGKLMYDQDNYESGGGRFMGTVGQLTAGPQPQTVGSFLTADPGAPGVTIKPYTKTMPQPDADVEAEAGEPIRARNQFDVAIAREAFGSPEEFYYDTQGRVQQNPLITEAKDRRAEKGATRIGVNVAQEKEENKTVGKGFGEQYNKIQEDAFNARRQVDRVDRLVSLLDGVETGKLTPLGTDIASYAKSFGFNIDPKLGNKEAAAALANEMALELRNPSGGAGMPGAMSDQDREFLRSMIPGMERTDQGRKLIADFWKRIAQRKQDVAKIARDYRKQNGQLDEGFYDALDAYSASNPMFTPEDRKALEPRKGKVSAAPTNQRITATNPTTGERIMSTDGGKTWQPLR